MHYFYRGRICIILMPSDHYCGINSACCQYLFSSNFSASDTFVASDFSLSAGMSKPLTWSIMFHPATEREQVAADTPMLPGRHTAGVASREDIDTAISVGLNHTMGTLTLTDFLGIDVLYYGTCDMDEKFKEPQCAPLVLLQKMIAAGWYGRKASRGFYKYK